MELKTVAAMGLGATVGAAAALLLPKQCPIRRAADNAAKAVKEEVSKVTGTMMM